MIFLKKYLPISNGCILNLKKNVIGRCVLLYQGIKIFLGENGYKKKFG